MEVGRESSGGQVQVGLLQSVPIYGGIFFFLSFFQEENLNEITLG